MCPPRLIRGGGRLLRVRARRAVAAGRLLLRALHLPGQAERQSGERGGNGPETQSTLETKVNVPGYGFCFRGFSTPRYGSITPGTDSVTHIYKIMN